MVSPQSNALRYWSTTPSPACLPLWLSNLLQSRKGKIRVQQQLLQLELATQPQVTAISQHPVFKSIDSIDKLCLFSEIHVFAVWDFMCLLKELQRKLTRSSLFWLPPENHLGCHLVNTLIAEEESDQLGDNYYTSHFELYLSAMQQCGASTEAISTFISDIRQNLRLDTLLAQPYIPYAAKRFVADTFTVITREAHAVAASFAFARENITGGMFSAILRHIVPTEKKYLIDQFIHYFQRHIDLDDGKHSEQSKILVTHLCGSDDKKWEEAKDTALFSLKSRLQLLDGIYAYITTGAY
jgi:hypothetical protein